MASLKLACCLLFIAAGVSAEVTRPCDVSDIACIREFFASAAGCTAVSETEGLEPYYVAADTPYNTVEYPFLNSTVIRLTNIITGLSQSSVQDLFVDEETQQITLVLSHPEFVTTGEAIFEYHNIADIDLEVETDYTFEYTEVTTKTVWTNLVPAYFAKIDSVPVYDAATAIPGVYEAAQIYPEIAESRAQAAARPDVKAKEDIFSLRALIASAVFSKTICA